MSGTSPSRQESAIPVAEPYRGAYERHSLKRNGIPTIANSRKLRATKKARHPVEPSKVVGVSGDGQAMTAVDIAMQGGPHSMESIRVTGEKALLTEEFSSSLVLSDSDDSMAGFASEMTDEEFVSADEDFEQTVTLKHAGPHHQTDCAMPLDNVMVSGPREGAPLASAPAATEIQGQQSATPSANAIRGIPMPTDSFDFNLPRGGRNNRIEAAPHGPFRADFITAGALQAPVFTPPPPGSAGQGNGSQETGNRGRSEASRWVRRFERPGAAGFPAGGGVSAAMAPSRQPPGASPQNHPIVPPFAPPSGPGGHKNGPEAANDRCLGGAMSPGDAVSPMEGVDCARSGIYLTNVSEGVGGERMGGSGNGTLHKLSAHADWAPGIEANAHCPSGAFKQTGNNKHGGRFHAHGAGKEVEGQGGGESEVELERGSDSELEWGSDSELDQGGDGAVDRGRSYRARRKAPRRDDGHRSRGRKPAPERVHTPKPFTEAENNFKLSIRLHISEIYGHRKPFPIQTPPRSQLDAFKKSQKGVDGPSLENFLLDFDGPTVSTLWNERLALLLANQFLKEQHSFTSQTAEVRKAFMVYFRTLHRRYWKSCAALGGDEAIKEQQDKRRSNQSARQRYLRNRREEAAKRYAKEGPQMKAFSELWKRMPKEACSDDEEVVYPNGAKVHEILTPGWRNVAVRAWFRTWDHLAVSMRYGPDGKPNPGRFPHVRVEAQPQRRGPHATAPPKLPLNFYDRDWYGALDSIEKQKLEAGPAVSLAFPPQVVRTAERYEHIKDRKDRPLGPHDPTLTPI